MKTNLTLEFDSVEEMNEVLNASKNLLPYKEILVELLRMSKYPYKDGFQELTEAQHRGIGFAIQRLTYDKGLYKFYQENS